MWSKKENCSRRFMPKFKCTFTYDVPHYAEFVIEAKDAKEAEFKIKRAFQKGKFNDVEAEPDYDCTTGSKVYLVEAAPRPEGQTDDGPAWLEGHLPTMEELFKMNDDTSIKSVTALTAKAIFKKL